MKNKIFTMLVLLMTAVTGAWAEDTYNVTFNANGNTKVVENVTLPHTFSCYYNGSIGVGDGELDLIIQELYGFSGGWCDESSPWMDNAVSGVTVGISSDNQYFSISTPFEGTAQLKGWYYRGWEDDFVYTLDIAIAAVDPSDPVLNADGTEASFDMPAYDVTVDYELVRDMTQSMTVSVQDAQGKTSIRLKKTLDGKYQPADMTTQQMAGLITVTDGIEQQTLTNNTDYTVSIFAVDDNDQPTGTAIAFADLTPGRYVAIATAKEGTIYDGRTLPSNIFKLFVGYEVEVEAGQYATFYKDENLKLAEETVNAELRTITSVEADKAIVGGDFTIAPKLTPLLVHNTADVKQTILLIPTEEHPDEVQFASQFMGTLTGTTLEVASNTKTSYALNGTQFVWVKYQPLVVPANKCWLEVTNAAGVKAITLVDEDDATGINAIDNGQLTIDNDWYDLNGRKIQTPKQRGIYINNGKKVVVK